MHNVRHQEELDVLERSPLEIIRLKHVLAQLKVGKRSGKRDFTASGKDLIDLMLMDRN